MKMSSRKMKKFLSLSLCILISAGMLSACSGGAASSSTAGAASAAPTSGGANVAAVKDLGNGVKQVTVAVLDGMAPYTYTDENGKMQGYDYEWMQMCDKLIPEYEFKYVSVSADAAPAAIQAGTYAFSASAHFVTPARKQNFILSIPESYYPVNLISSKKDSFTKFEQLNGKSLVPNPPNDGLSIVLKDLSAKYPDVKYKQDPTSEYIPYMDGMKDVEKGKYDCWFGGETMYNDIIKKSPAMKDTMFCSEPITTAGGVAVINKNLTNLRDKLDEATVKLYKDGSLGKLSAKWLGKDYFKVAKDTNSLYAYDHYTAGSASSGS
ncbi:MAG: transporter substrate-binding domain-containing protein [Oscillospiraceae bacterium]|jgi:L-cystine transport system substrate-binding protein|nr:transporter substrate-binding domain-containing protein [Oscillospiraceae bacterium]